MNKDFNNKKSLLATACITLMATSTLAACGNSNGDKNNSPINPTVSSTSGIVGNSKSSTPTISSTNKTNTSTNKPSTNTPKTKDLKTYHTDSNYVSPTTKKNAPNNTDKSTTGKNNSTSTNSDLNNSATIDRSGKIHSPSNTHNNYTPKSSGVAKGYPVSISVPKMGLYHSIASYGTRGGILDPYPNSVQYYTGSVLPGKVGNSVIASHVTYNGVPKAFYYLNALTNGDKFTITYSNGAKKTFQVYNKESVNKYKLKYDQRVWGSSNTANVVLLSCDKNSGWMKGHMHRTNNYVVWAKLV